jgi:hypothetical protein
VTILYHDKDRRLQLIQPQIIRSRQPFRGPRESAPLNLEIHQMYYDVGRLYTRVRTDVDELSEDIDTLINGGTVVDAVEVEGLVSLMERVDRLRSRIAALEE